MTVVCSGPRFESLVNPYTGEPVKTVMTVSSDGIVRFRAPDTYSPAQLFPTAHDAYRAYNRTLGTEGLRTGKPIVCAYTGAPMHLEKTPDGYRYVGGFDPRMFYDRETYLHFSSMVDGVARFQRNPETRVTRPPKTGTVTESMRKHADDSAARAELSDDAIHMSEDTVRKLEESGMDIGSGRTTVSMSGASDQPHAEDATKSDVKKVAKKGAK